MFAVLLGAVWVFFGSEALSGSVPWESAHASLEIFSVFLALYLGAGVFWSEMASRNWDIILLRGVSRAEWFWSKLAGLLTAGTVIVLISGLILCSSVLASDQAWILLLRGWLTFALTFSMAFFLSVFLRGYLNSAAAFLTLLFSDISVLLGASRLGQIEPVWWGRALPPYWHLSALRQLKAWDSRVQDHVLPVLIYIVILAVLGMLLFRQKPMMHAPQASPE